MGKPVDRVRASDITFWGLFALLTWAVALFGANLAVLIPPGVLGGLHSSRLEGANVNQLRGQVVALQAETARLRQENSVLLQRFMLNEQASGTLAQRVGALEMTLPQILETLQSGTVAIDPGTTASTGGDVTTFDVPGGAVAVRQSPMPQASRSAAIPAPLEAPVAVRPDSNAFGIAIGPPIDANEGEAAWLAMNDRVGALLLGLGPLLGNVEGSGGKRLVAGPIIMESDARQLCGRMAKAGIACATVPFIGVPLPLMN